ncbi:MAG: DUF2815 family protein [Oscillospiraceae bacterium]
MYNNDALKVLTGECRLSFVHLSEPYAHEQGQEPKYSVTLLIPKTDVATKADIDASIQAAINEGITKSWNGQRPAAPKIPLYDGDGVRPNGEAFGEECRGCWVMTASSKADRKPEVVHISNVRSQLAPSDVYSGMYGRVTIRFFTYNTSGNRGVGCGLGNVLKTRDGEALSASRASAESEFAALEQPAPANAYPATLGYGYAAPVAPTYPAYAAPAPAANYPPQQGAVNPFTGLPM